MEDDQTVLEMRKDKDKPSRLDKPFMAAGELYTLRTETIRTTQQRLCDQLVSPSTGETCSTSIMSLWEKGKRPIPLWVARKVRDLAECARRLDAKEG